MANYKFTYEQMRFIKDNQSEGDLGYRLKGYCLELPVDQIWRNKTLETWLWDENVSEYEDSYECMVKKIDEQGYEYDEVDLEMLIQSIIDDGDSLKVLYPDNRYWIFIEEEAEDFEYALGYTDNQHGEYNRVVRFLDEFTDDLKHKYGYYYDKYIQFKENKGWDLKPDEIKNEKPKIKKNI